MASFKEKLAELNFNSSMGSSFDEFIGFLELPDEQFDAVYPQFKSKLAEVFENPEAQKDIKKIAANIPFTSKEEELKIVQSALDAVDEIDDLSENKKDMIKMLIDFSSKATLELYEVPRERISVDVMRLNDKAKLPTYAHPTDAGADIYSAETCTIEPNMTKAVSTALAIAIPVGYVVQIYPRSGLSAKTGLRIANSVGIIDSDYRGEIKVLLHNTSDQPVTISIGDRIAQMLIAESPMIRWKEKDSLDQTARGDGGFGSTGKS